METERQKRINEKRRQQPIAELERKWEKAKGRVWRAYWSQEALDLAHARGRELADRLFGKLA